MSGYSAPLKDIRFALEHIAELDPVLRTAVDNADRDTVDAMLDEFGRFVGTLIAPLNRSGDITGSRLAGGQVRMPEGFADAYRKYVEAGWGSVCAPPEWGGAGMPRILGVAMEEMLAAASLSFSNAPLLTGAGVSAIVAHGTHEQRQLYLPKLVVGEWSATMELTEPQAGSDVGAIMTRAEPAGDGSYRIRGTKIFVTYGDHDMASNVVHLVLARVGGACPGTKGLSMFIVPKFLPDPDGTPGKPNDVKVVSLEHKLGIKAAPTCVMAYGEDRGGAVGYLLGKPGEGITNMFTMMNTARVSVGIQGMAVAERAYQQAVAYAQERQQGRAPARTTGTSPIIEHPDVQRMLLTMRASIAAMRALIYRTARHQDMSGHDPSPERRRWHASALALLTPIVKSWCTDTGLQMTSLGIQVHGGAGFMEETGAAQHWRDARITPIYEGTNGIQAIDLVRRKIHMDAGNFVRSYLRSLYPRANRLHQAGWHEAGRQLEEALTGLEQATDWMVANRDREEDVLAGASPYCHMFGGVVAGAMMAESALAASTAGLPEQESAAIYYLTRLLPVDSALRHAATAGAVELHDSQV